MLNSHAALPQISSLPHDTVNAYLGALAVVSVRYRIVIDSGSLLPIHADVGGYLLTTGGYLRVYPPGDRIAHFVQRNLADMPGQCDPYTRVADIAGLSADDVLRFYHRLYISRAQPAP